MKQRPKVLLVEDNDTLALIASIHLSRFELDFDRVRDGAEAVEAVQKTEYDLILMDIRMATMNGFEATVRIRNLEKLSGQHANIIGVTASDSEAECRDAGMDEFVQKPADYADIIEHFFPSWERKPA